MFNLYCFEAQTPSDNGSETEDSNLHVNQMWKLLDNSAALSLLQLNISNNSSVGHCFIISNCNQDNTAIDIWKLLNVSEIKACALQSKMMKMPR